nr:RNA methyltransferase [Propionibacteriales bacterium]
RCADAAGADAVVLAGASVDPYNGKAVRASAGSLFHQPVVVAASVSQTVSTLKRRGLVVIAADGAGEASLDDLSPATLRAPTAWLFGNEAWGLSVDVRALADRVVRVPIYGRAESLNLATAAAVCLYTSAREQHRGTGERTVTPGTPGKG